MNNNDAENLRFYDIYDSTDWYILVTISGVKNLALTIFMIYG